MLKSRLTQWRRNRLRDQIIKNGRKLDDLYRKRCDIDPEYWPDDWEYLSDLIDNREARAEKLRGKLADTHKED